MLQSKLAHLPPSAGVYQFFDAAGRLLYIGKAKSLKHRVKSYFRFSPILGPNPALSPRIHKMISETVSLDYLLLSSEHDAFILENSLIKQLKPKYNILLRDDKTYPYIYIDFSKPYPRFDITRKVIKGKNIRYFGPFSSGAKDVLGALYLLFPLVQKRGCERTKKACLFFQMGRCLAPCEGKITPEAYHEMAQAAAKLIHRPRVLYDALHEKMETYAQALHFEEAAQLRDMAQHIRSMGNFTHLDLAKLEDFDIFAIYAEPTIVCGLRLFIREGKVVSSSHTMARTTSEFEPEALYRQLLLDAYPPQSPMTTHTLFTAHPLEEAKELEAIIGARHQCTVSIKHPKRGEKHHLITLALTNAKELCAQHLRKSTVSLQEDLARYFEFSKPPERIEVFDNSHLGGEASVGAIVCWENDSFLKSAYRHYHLHSKDEYGQMRELLTQRALRFDTQSAPDLWVIDGGKTLLELARSILESAGVSVDVIAIAKEKIDAKAHRAKGAAKDILHTTKGFHALSSQDTKLQFFQRLRDEAHRFAISFHRKTKRAQDKNHSILKQLGLSEGAIKKLLLYFGTFEAVAQASPEELSLVVGKRIAQRLSLAQK
ncbi:MAG: excinuclease ABC subunit UvrC [Campylobacterales bacterium]|nr:excinuclease ABC subunit UvrC [Campylobacterales bacterium]